MATKATHNLSVKTAKYINEKGEEKARWVRLGKILQKDDGSKFILIDRTFNPAGVPNEDSRDTIIVSIFKIDEQAPAPVVATSPVPPVNNLNDIPF